MLKYRRGYEIIPLCAAFIFFIFFKKMCIAVFVAGLYSIFEVRALKTHHTAPINTE